MDVRRACRSRGHAANKNQRRCDCGIPKHCTISFLTVGAAKKPIPLPLLRLCGHAFNSRPIIYSLRCRACDLLRHSALGSHCPNSIHLFLIKIFRKKELLPNPHGAIPLWLVRSAEISSFWNHSTIAGDAMPSGETAAINPSCELRMVFLRVRRQTKAPLGAFHQEIELNMVKFRNDLVRMWVSVQACPSNHIIDNTLTCRISVA